jgi:hypothetical protein
MAHAQDADVSRSVQIALAAQVASVGLDRVPLKVRET